MNVTYGEKTDHKPEYALLQEATRRLEEVLGQSADLVAVEWKRGQDERGRLLYTLRLSDFAGAVSATFAPDELRSPSHQRYRLLDLWGDLLQVRSDAQMKKIHQL